MLIRTQGSGKWRSPEVTRYPDENAIQALLAQSPELVSGIGTTKPAVAREVALSTGYVDIVVVAPDGAITLVECKLKANPEIRRHVIGQILAYAASLWELSYEAFDQAFSARAQQSLVHSVQAIADEGWDEEVFRIAVTDNLAAGRFRLVIAVDEITLERYNLELSGGFYEWFFDIASLKSTKTRRLEIAISPYFVARASQHCDYFTKEFIRGPKGLSVKKLNDPNFPELSNGTVTEHQRLEQTFETSFFSVDMYKLQVMWSSRNGIKTVQIVEVVPVDAKEFLELPIIANRYVHAEWDPASNSFRHFDGAVRIYSKENYTERIAIDPRSSIWKKSTLDYKKLFRLDGTLEVEYWSILVTRFFEGNELVPEYLLQAGESEDESDTIARFQEQLRSQSAGKVNLGPNTRSIG